MEKRPESFFSLPISFLILDLAICIHSKSFWMVAPFWLVVESQCDLQVLIFVARMTTSLPRMWSSTLLVLSHISYFYRTRKKPTGVPVKNLIKGLETIWRWRLINRLFAHPFLINQHIKKKLRKGMVITKFQLKWKIFKWWKNCEKVIALCK